MVEVQWEGFGRRLERPAGARPQGPQPQARLEVFVLFPQRAMQGVKFTLARKELEGLGSGLCSCLGEIRADNSYPPCLLWLCIGSEPGWPRATPLGRSWQLGGG